MVQRDSGTKRSVNCSWFTSTLGAGVVCVTHHGCPAHPSTPVSQTFVEYLLCVSHCYQCSRICVPTLRVWWAQGQAREWISYVSSENFSKTHKKVKRWKHVQRV